MIGGLLVVHEGLKIASEFFFQLVGHWEEFDNMNSNKFCCSKKVLRYFLTTTKPSPNKQELFGLH